MTSTLFSLRSVESSREMYYPDVSRWGLELKEECRNCKGKGSYKEEDPYDMGWTIPKDCKHCWGSGEVDRHPIVVEAQRMYCEIALAVIEKKLSRKRAIQILGPWFEGNDSFDTWIDLVSGVLEREAA